VRLAGGAGRAGHVVLALLAAAFLTIGLYEAAHDSPTVDEGVDLASGVTSLVRHDLRLSPEHPFLPKVLAAIPALAAQPVVPDTAAYRDGDWFDYTDDFISANEDAGRLRRVLFLSRLVPLLEGLACAALMYALARRLFGVAPAILAAALWLTTPVVIGLSHFAMIDIPFVLATLGVSLLLVYHLERPSDRRAVLVGLACGASLLTRHTGLVLLATAAVVVVAAGWRAGWRLALRWAAVLLLVAWASVWVAVRAADPTPVAGAPRDRMEGIVGAARHDSVAARIALAVPWPLEYRAGFGYLFLTSDPRPAYLFGHMWEGSEPWFFPGSLLIKVPLGALVVLLAGPFLWQRVPRERRRLALLAVVTPGAVAFVALLLQPLNLGLRYAFPSLALWIVAASPAALAVQGTARAVAAGALAVSQVAALAAAVPHSLAWTPPPFQPGYRYASDSNIDYGQDLFRLRDWVRDKDRPYVAVIAPRGLGELDGTRPLRGADPATITGWVAAGVTPLTVTDRDELSWLRAYCPVGDIGGSILLYRFDEPPDPTPGPAMPVSACSAGEEFSTR
jgi:hypothetical protein